MLVGSKVERLATRAGSNVRHVDEEKNGSNLRMYSVVPRNDMLRILGRNLPQAAGLGRGNPANLGTCDCEEKRYSTS